jgi:hypothetical protein
MMASINECAPAKGCESPQISTDALWLDYLMEDVLSGEIEAHEVLDLVELTRPGHVGAECRAA